MQLCELKGRFLFEADPFLFPGGRLSAEEIIAWGAYYEMESERKEGVGANGVRP